jgi:hypothetical protein
MSESGTWHTTPAGQGGPTKMHRNHIFSLDRGLIVFASFVIWISAAGLICWALVPKQITDDQPAVTNPASIVHIEAAGITSPRAQITVAQR